MCAEGVVCVSVFVPMDLCVSMGVCMWLLACECVRACLSQWACVCVSLWAYVYACVRGLTGVGSVSHDEHAYGGEVGVLLLPVGHHGPVEVSALHQGHTCCRETKGKVH